ncbi:hypothetical protein [Rhizobium sp. MHM7A]|uniref:hypothetical protein n=1 Tax=Rhizobium sp. MHM7A TaxID=2583233 RepID=UPI00110726CE|nr:hypothetical protein [Rhizobium sp. MHM7A]TLX15877.1 hypothetical protein FFR93_00755 [Rhizobium sp. MHM7A]
MSFVEKLNDRIRSKITPQTSARITAIREREHGIEIAGDNRAPEYGADIHDSMWAFSHRAAAQAEARQAQIDEAAPVMRM